MGYAGVSGVSDTLASGTWAVDYLFDMASLGVTGVNLAMMYDATNSPVTTDGNGGSLVVHPLSMAY